MTGWRARRAPDATRLRPMEPADLTNVLALEHDLFPDDPWTAEMFAEEVVQPEVLSRLYGRHVDVIRVHGRILVVAAPEGIDATEAAAEDIGVAG